MIILICVQKNGRELLYLSGFRVEYSLGRGIVKFACFNYFLE